MNIRQAVLWDSSAILALLDADDADHERAVAIAGQIASERRPSFITNYVEVEAQDVVASEVGEDAGPRMAPRWRSAGDPGTSAGGGSRPGDRRSVLR